MKNTGILLKTKREGLNLSLSEVALSTKINPKILAAIESGEDNGLPAKTILKGFVKSYAIFLKMDVDEVLRTFQEETGGPPAPTPTAVPATDAMVRKAPARSETAAPPTRRRVDEESSTGMRTAGVAVIVVLIGLIIGVRELFEKYQRERVVEQPVELKASPIVAKVEEAPVEVKPEEKVEAKADDKPVEKVEEAKPEEKVAEAKPAEEKPAEEKPVTKSPPVLPYVGLRRNLVELQPGRPAVVADIKAEEQAATVKAEETAAATPPPGQPTTPAAAIKAAKNEVILEALDKVDVKFELKGETKRVSLGPTQVHTIRSDEPMTIDFSDGGAVNVILNGRERGPAGDLGKPKTIKIP